MAHDKKLHFIAGLIISGLTGLAVIYLLKNDNLLVFMVSFGMSVLAGTGKEIYDSMNPDRHVADLYDAVYTFAGGLVAAIAVIAISALL